METTIATWEDQLSSIWASIDDVEPNVFLAAIDAHLADLPVGSAIGAFEAAASRDSTGHSDQAVPFYRYALDIGLEGERRRRAVIQLASSLRNVGEFDEGLRLLEEELARVEGAAASTAESGEAEPAAESPAESEQSSDESDDTASDDTTETVDDTSDNSSDNSAADDTATENSDEAAVESSTETVTETESEPDAEPEAEPATDAAPAVVDDYLVDELRAFLALFLIDAGREREAAIMTLKVLAPHLSRYQRSLAGYAAALPASR